MKREFDLFEAAVAWVENNRLTLRQRYRDRWILADYRGVQDSGCSLPAMLRRARQRGIDLTLAHVEFLCAEEPDRTL